jgi:cell division protein FtsB
MVKELIILVLILAAGLLYSKRNEWFGNNSLEITQKQADTIEFYKREFEGMSTEELIKKGNEDRLVEEALLAIDLLLKERNANPNNFS